MIYYETASTDPRINLAAEDYLLHQAGAEDVLFLWQNAPCVIIGRNQCAAQEVDLDLARQLGVPVVRRDTGGGAVYHDLGNLNFTFLTADRPALDSPYASFLTPLIAVLASFGVAAEFNGRNDLCVQGRKISGSAARVHAGRLLHHGTLLVASDLAPMTRLLTPPQEKLRRNGVASVQSRVANLQRRLRELNDAIADEQVSAHIDAIERTSGRIFAYVAENPKKAPQIRKFMNYYLPATIKILSSYERMSAQGVRGENIEATMTGVEKILGTIETAFANQLDHLFADEALDISTDITVLEGMMAQEGLTDDGLRADKN